MHSLSFFFSLYMSSEKRFYLRINFTLPLFIFMNCRNPSTSLTVLFAFIYSQIVCLLYLFALLIYLLCFIHLHNLDLFSYNLFTNNL